MEPTTKAGFTGRARSGVAAILYHALAEELLLSSTTRDFSGTVPNFHSLHRLFLDQYRQLERWVDQLATRTWALGSSEGGDAKLTELTAARCVNLPERVPASDMVGELLTLHEQLAARLREDVQKCSQQLGDRGTADVLAGLVEFHENTAWLLRMVLQGPAPTRV